jgi:integrase
MLAGGATPDPAQDSREEPLWLSTVMRYHIQPKARNLGVAKKVSWHTFRHTFSTLLKANGEDVKVVQELLRHASAKMTLDTYSQALTPAKRAAQSKVVSMIRPKSVITGLGTCSLGGTIGGSGSWGARKDLI